MAEAIVDRKWESLGETTNGWRYNLAGGRSNHDPALRAALCKYMVGDQLAEQVLYPNCRVDADGSLTILIQHARPADTANWLPAPAGSFNLTMRFYGPATAVLDGSYRLPAVQKIS